MINILSKENSFLNNFYEATIIDIEGTEYKTVEHFYQAQKVLLTNAPDKKKWFKLIVAANSPREARDLGQRCPYDKEWEGYKVQTMYKALLLKFLQNKEIQKKLLDTGDEYLEESGKYVDDFWGNSSGGGLNMMGLLLMRVRNYINSLD